MAKCAEQRRIESIFKNCPLILFFASQNLFRSSSRPKFPFIYFESFATWLSKEIQKLLALGTRLTTLIEEDRLAQELNLPPF